MRRRSCQGLRRVSIDAGQASGEIRPGPPVASGKGKGRVGMSGWFAPEEDPQAPPDAGLGGGADQPDILPPLPPALPAEDPGGDAPPGPHGSCVIGDPDHDGCFWAPQTTGFTSVVMAERGIIAALTGDDVSEAQLVYEATASGLLSDHGMSAGDVGEILRLHSVPCHHNDRATVEDIVAELTLGHKVIVGVDAGELRDPDHPLAGFTGQAADHAIWVTGVDESDPDHPKVIINDSGDPHGAGRAYDLDRFIDAWEHAGFRYVATDGGADDGSASAGAAAAALGLLLAVRLSARNATSTPLLLPPARPHALEDGRSRHLRIDFGKLDQRARDALIRRL